MAKILNNKKSTGSKPYAYYSVEATSNNRSTSSVDVTIKVTSNLQADASSLGIGNNFGLIGYITLNNTEYSMTLKSTNVTWKGTGKHTTTSTFNVNVPGSQSQLTNVKFRVSRTGSAANDYSKGAALSSTACSNISIGIGHTNPTNVSYTIEETNQKLINAQLPETTWVKNLSQKKITLSYTLHDNASVEFYGYADKYTMYGKKNNPFISTSFDINKDSGTNNKVTVYGYIEDSLGAIGKSNSTRYDFIEYIETSLNESTTRVNGQLSGRAKLNIKGSFFNGIIGTINQSGNYKPTIKYKYWKLNDQEPETFDNIISADNITISNNTFTVNDLEIGSSDETASNYFNPDYAYRVKIYVEDNFTSYTSQEKPIPVGEATWTEYKDRVDFKKITIKGKDISENQILWQGAWYMNASQTANLSQKVSEQQHGIVLVWQAYSSGSAQSWDYNFCFVPKWQALTNSGRGVSMWLTADAGHIVASKYVYVYDDKIAGHANNSAGATKRNSGITTTNNYWALTYVIGL